MYPSGFNNTDFIEPYAKLSGTVGPASLTAGVAYAPKQQALGAWSSTGAIAAAGIYDNPNDKNDNLYLWGDGACRRARDRADGKGPYRLFERQ